MTQTHADIQYKQHVEKVIAKKKMKLLKNTMIEASKEATALCSDFVHQWQKTIKIMNQKKTEYIMQKTEGLVKDYLMENPQAIIAMSIKLLKNIAEHTDVEMTVNTKNAKLIKASLGKIAMACASTRKIIITEDDTLDVASVIIKADKSIIDAHLKTQLDKAYEVLINRIGYKYGSNN